MVELSSWSYRGQGRQRSETDLGRCLTGSPGSQDIGPHTLWLLGSSLADRIENNIKHTVHEPRQPGGWNHIYDKTKVNPDRDQETWYPLAECSTHPNTTCSLSMAPPSSLLSYPTNPQAQGLMPLISFIHLLILVLISNNSSGPNNLLLVWMLYLPDRPLFPPIAPFSKLTAFQNTNQTMLLTRINHSIVP